MSQSTHIADCIDITAYLSASHLLLLFFKRPWIQSFKGFHVICYLHDILITGNSDKEHLYTLGTVLQRLQQYGFRLKREKCEFLQQSVEYLGHRIDSEGLHLIPSKLHAITQAPAPQNVQELRSFSGLLNYYGKFIPNLAYLIQPLNSLLQHNHKWKWSEDCDQVCLSQA